MKKAIINISNMSLKVANRLVLNNLNLSIYQNEITGIIGPNGAGKSTLLKAIAGVCKYDSGQLLIMGKPQRLWTKEKLAKILAYMPQNSEVHWPLSVHDLVALGRLPYLKGFTSTIRHQDKKIIDYSLQFTGTSHLQNRIVTELSGGELSRVLLARAIAVEAPVMLADEPVSQLDPYYQLLILNLLKEKTKRNMTIVIVLHDLLHAARFCNRIVLLHKGEIVADGAPENVLNNDNMKKYYQVELGQAKINEQNYGLPWNILPKSTSTVN